MDQTLVLILHPKPQVSCYRRTGHYPLWKPLTLLKLTKWISNRWTVPASTPDEQKAKQIKRGFLLKQCSESNGTPKHIRCQSCSQRRTLQKASYSICCQLCRWPLRIPDSIHPEGQADPPRPAQSKEWMGWCHSRGEHHSMAEMDLWCEANVFIPSQHCPTASLLWCQWMRLQQCEIPKINQHGCKSSYCIHAGVNSG